MRAAPRANQSLKRTETGVSKKFASILRFLTTEEVDHVSRTVIHAGNVGPSWSLGSDRALGRPDRIGWNVPACGRLETAERSGHGGVVRHHRHWPMVPVCHWPHRCRFCDYVARARN